jgi:hypothetical protein
MRRRACMQNKRKPKVVDDDDDLWAPDEASAADAAMHSATLTHHGRVRAGGTEEGQEADVRHAALAAHAHSSCALARSHRRRLRVCAHGRSEEVAGQEHDEAEAEPEAEAAVEAEDADEQADEGSLQRARRAAWLLTSHGVTCGVQRPPWKSWRS